MEIHNQKVKSRRVKQSHSPKAFDAEVLKTSQRLRLEFIKYNSDYLLVVRFCHFGRYCKHLLLTNLQNFKVLNYFLNHIYENPLEWAFRVFSFFFSQPFLMSMTCLAFSCHPSSILFELVWLKLRSVLSRFKRLERLNLGSPLSPSPSGLTPNMRFIDRIWCWTNGAARKLAISANFKKYFAKKIYFQIYWIDYIVFWRQVGHTVIFFAYKFDWNVII